MDRVRVLMSKSVTRKVNPTDVVRGLDTRPIHPDDLVAVVIQAQVEGIALEAVMSLDGDSSLQQIRCG